MKRKHKKVAGLFALALVVAALVALVMIAPQKRGKIWRAPVHMAVVEPPEALPLYTEEQPAPAPPPQEEQLAAVLTPVLPKPEEVVRPHVKGKPRIAIVIDDLGPDVAETARAIRLPSAVTLAFLPYAARLSEETARGRAAGHELLVHMPMEPVGDENPGPGALRVDQSPEEIQARLDKAFSSFSGYDGLNNHMGSKFTSYPEGMELVVKELQKRGLYFLDSRTNLKTVGFDAARAHNLPAAMRDVFLDNDRNAPAIRAQLVALEREARRKGEAIAIGHPHPETLQALETWIPDAQARGFVIVPLRDLVH